MQFESPPTLASIATELYADKVREKDYLPIYTHKIHYRKKWRHEEQLILKKLINSYGSDFTLIEQFLPHKTRRQIQKRCQLLAEIEQRRYDRQRIITTRQKRKMFFDVELLRQGKIMH